MLLNTLLLFIVGLFRTTYLASVSNPLHAEEQDRAELALTALLFEMDRENVAYSVRGDGFVDILFGPSVSKRDDWSTINAIKQHPEIDGVLPGRGVSDNCPIP